MLLNWMDYAIIAVVGLSVITGIFRGFVKESIALLVWVIAIWLGMTYYTTFDPWLVPYIHDRTLRIAVAFIAIVLLALIAGSLFNAMIGMIIKRSGLSRTDRLLGMIFGFVRGIFIVALMLLVVKFNPMPEYTQTSYLYGEFDPIVNWLYKLIPDSIKNGYSSNKAI